MSLLFELRCLLLAMHTADIAITTISTTTIHIGSMTPNSSVFRLVLDFDFVVAGDIVFASKNKSSFA